jgi:hypothetical protein
VYLQLTGDSLAAWFGESVTTITVTNELSTPRAAAPPTVSRGGRIGRQRRRHATRRPGKKSWRSCPARPRTGSTGSGTDSRSRSRSAPGGSGRQSKEQPRCVAPDDPHPQIPAASLPGLLRDIFTAAGGVHDDWDAYDRVMAEERRVAVLITPRRAYTNPGSP